MLQSLIDEACKYPPGSPERQKLLTKIIRLTAGKLWRETTPYYQDALQQTWLYFCRNLCEATTATEPYDSTKGTIVTWLNFYLRRRLQDFYIKSQQEIATTVSATAYQSASGDRSEVLDPINNLPANPDIPPILELIQSWVEKDKDGELRQIHIQNRPEVNCQMLILKRLPPEVGWKELATEYNLTVSTLSSFYQRQCLPRLRKFAETEGIL
jgi:hypothetical protein